jgi:hypothetical protein
MDGESPRIQRYRGASLGHDKGSIIANDRTLYGSPSPSGRELEGGGFHPHLNPLPSGERSSIPAHAVNYTCKQHLRFWLRGHV